MTGAVSKGGPTLGDPGLGAAEQMVAEFDGADSLSYDPAHSAGYGLFTGSHEGTAAAPAGDNSQYMAIGAGGSVLFDLRSFGGGPDAISSLSVYIGSVDPYNFIDVLGTNTGGDLDYAHPLLTIGGSDLPGSDGDWYSALSNGRLTIDFDPTDHVGGIVFRSTGVSFEFDSIAIGMAGPHQENPPAVPEPASWAMMLSGFGMVGGAMRNRRKLGFART